MLAPACNGFIDCTSVTLRGDSPWKGRDLAAEQRETLEEGSDAMTGPLLPAPLAKALHRQRGQVMMDGSVTLEWFVRNRYFPIKESDWKEETAKNKKSLIQTNLLDPLGEIPRIGIDRFSLQLHVKELAKKCAKDTVLQMCAYLRDIFEEAVDLDFLTKNPAARLKVPDGCAKPTRPRSHWSS